jgi:bifunctional ADP-heptose synthase (sugar kinase/adenylyltransferase)
MSHRPPLHDRRHFQPRLRRGTPTLGGIRPRVDTRSKILSRDAALGLPPPLTVVTGYFDVLRAEHAGDLQQARDRSPAQPLLVVVLTGYSPIFRPVLDPGARAELVAALRMVDYVVTADDGDRDHLIEALKPAQLVRLEAADQRRARQLREHVQRRQTS